MVYLNALKSFVRARSRKRRPRLPAVSSIAIVSTDLNPGGSVLADGELWTAEACDRKSIPSETRVTVVGFRDHVLLVEDNS